QQLQVAALALAYDRNRREQHHGERQYDADQPRYDVDRSASFRIVIGAYFQASLHRRCGVPRVERNGHRYELVRDAENGRVGSIDQEVRVGAGIDDTAVEIVWDVYPYRYFPRPQQDFQFFGAFGRFANREDLGVSKFC